MATQPMPAATPLKLTDTIKSILANALTSKKPVVFAYVDDEGRPNLSFRGSALVYSDTQLAVWVRNPGGGLQKAIGRHPHVALMYSDFGAEKRSFLNFRGRAHVDSSEAARKRVYEESPEVEQKLDAERKGFALIIDLDSVQGVAQGERMNMAQG